MLRHLMFLLAAVLTLSLAGCSQDTPVEEAEEEAGVEEVVEPSPEEIQSEGCPEGQVSNAAGTECMDKGSAPKHEPDPAYTEEADRKESERIVKAYESGMSNVEPVECQLAKAQLDLGSQETERLLDEWMAPAMEGPSVQELQEQGVEPKEAMQQVSERMKSKGTLPEYLADKGYTC